MSIPQVSSQLVFDWLWPSVWQSGVLIALILVTRKVLVGRMNAAWRYRLWWVLILRLALPFPPESVTSIFNLLPERAPFRTRNGGAIPVVVSRTPIMARIRSIASFQPPSTWSSAGVLCIAGLAMLTLTDAQLTASKLRVIQGRVLDADTKLPIAQARIVLHHNGDSRKEAFAPTAANGRFLINAPMEGSADLLVTADGKAPHLTSIEFETLRSPLELRMLSPRRVRGRVLDESDRPLEGVRLSAGTWQGVNLLNWETTTDHEGNFAWDSAPRESFSLAVEKTGFNPIWYVVPTNSEAFLAFRLVEGFRLRATVVDADTRQPVDGVVVLETPFDLHGETPKWKPANLAESVRGRFTLAADPEWTGLVRMQIAVSAHGYLPAIFSAGPSASYQEVQIELRKGEGPRGMVQGINGQSVPEAQVALIGVAPLVVRNGGFRNPAWSRPEYLVTTGDDGRFVLPQLVPSVRVAAIHPELGFGETTLEGLSQTGRITLQPWGRLEGRLRIGEAPGTNQIVRLLAAAPADSEIRFDLENLQTTTDASDGYFVFTNLPPGKRTLVRGTSGSAAMEVQIVSGRTTHVSGGTGRTVVGKLVAGDASLSVDWSAGVYLLRSPLGALTNANRGAFPWLQKSLGSISARRNYEVEMHDDGTFVIEDVPPGTYSLFVSFGGFDLAHVPVKTSPLQSIERELVIPSSDGGRQDEPFDLGIIEVPSQ